MQKKFIFLLGGARSGKSDYALQLANQFGNDVLFVATAGIHDTEMEMRVIAHKESRPTHWHTLEAESHVAQVISNCSLNYPVLILDCITLLASNVVTLYPEEQLSLGEIELQREVDELIKTYKVGNATWIVISNEVGLGLVPPYPLGRLFRDALGRVNQRLATVADEVYFLVSGLPMKIK